MAGGMWVVKVGGQMPDWKKHELIQKFRSEAINVIIESGSGANISGESSIKRSF